MMEVSNLKQLNIPTLIPFFMSGGPSGVSISVGGVSVSVGGGGGGGGDGGGGDGGGYLERRRRWKALAGRRHLSSYRWLFPHHRLSAKRSNKCNELLAND